MKKFLFLLLACLFFAGQSRAYETEATLTNIGRNFGGDEPFLCPLETLELTFDRTIKMFDGAEAAVKCGGETVANAVSFEIYNNPESEDREKAVLSVVFDKQNLPKGKSYSLWLKKGSLGWTEMYNNIQIVNRELNIPFNVPADLGKGECFMDGEQVYSSEHLVPIFWYLDMAAVGEPKMLLYREDEKVGEYDVTVSNDFGRATVTPVFNEVMTFDNGIRYRFVLPEGSVSSACRSDIVNPEVTVNFQGCYIDPEAPFSFVWCSLYDSEPEALEVVQFIYVRPVSVAPEGKVQLWEGDCEEMLCEIEPVLDTSINSWLIVADFGHLELTSPKGYTLVVPEGMVISEDGIGVRSARSEVRLKGTSSIENIPVNTSEPVMYDLNGNRISNPASGTIYIRDGRKTLKR